MQFNHRVAHTDDYKGLGLFTTVPIMQGEVVWKFDKKAVKQYHTPSAIMHDCKHLTPTELKKWLSHCFSNEHLTIYHQKDLGAYMNHSTFPNLILAENGEDLIANFDIDPQTELTVDYIVSGEVDFPLWFFSFCEIHGVDFSYL